MKKLLFIGLIPLMNCDAYAENLSPNVVAEYVTHVGFAPEEYRGTYKLQVLYSGIVQKIDNKNNVTKLATLSIDSLYRIRTAIDHVKNYTMIPPEGPRCADAPSQEITVQQTSGRNLTIWKNTDCRVSKSSDTLANQVADIITDLQSVSGKIDSLGK